MTSPQIKEIKKTNVVLIGVPGAGKTTVGSLLATKLNREFIDSDQRIEEVTGKSISEIFIQDGEESFRATEKDVIAQAISQGDCVISLGGGALLNPTTRELVKTQRTIWLQTGLSQAVERIGMNRNRPLLLGNVRGQLADLMAAREPFYIECAQDVVVTNNLSPEQVAEQIIEKLEQV